MIGSLLIANRGEIACRIIRTARAMGIRTIAVYSDADAGALHTIQADEAVHIGPSPARESYLAGEKIIAAARQKGAEAIHPGYGFLSENAAFAQAVMDAGLIWVGPSPASITAMGLKDAAKKRMADAGVPVTPGYMGEDQAPDHLADQAGRIGYPVLIKAVAGGGGKGMRTVERAEDFAEALASCQREAAASFGNAHVLIEKYIQRPRHIEVQVFGDPHGNIVHLFERDCSVQRRHQKVIEEAPAPGMDAATREHLCCAAIRAAKAVGYVGAGTVEFIADASEGLRADRIWFLEMNTRLQVEHPVTEAITGVDLVEWQLRVASGEPLPKTQEQLGIRGWAMEARLYAEDPAKGFLPSVGTLDLFTLDPSRSAARIDTGVQRGSIIPPDYDPMIAKVIAHGDTRAQAAKTLVESLCHCAIWPVRSNAGFLVRLLRDEAFLHGEVDTGLIARNLARLTGPEPASNGVLNAALEALSILQERDARNAGQDPLWQASPWSQGNGFRLNQPAQTERRLIDSDNRVVSFPRGGAIDPALVTRSGQWAVVAEHGFTHALRRDEVRGSRQAGVADGAILSPMPGRIIAVDVIAGQTVAKGQPLLTLEAMKMEHRLTAPFAGTVAQLAAKPGAQVPVDAQLARICPAEPENQG